MPSATSTTVIPPTVVTVLVFEGGSAGVVEAPLEGSFLSPGAAADADSDESAPGVALATLDGRKDRYRATTPTKNTMLKNPAAMPAPALKRPRISPPAFET